MWIRNSSHNASSISDLHSHTELLHQELEGPRLSGDGRDSLSEDAEESRCLGAECSECFDGNGRETVERRQRAVFVGLATLGEVCDWSWADDCSVQMASGQRVWARKVPDQASTIGPRHHGEAVRTFAVISRQWVRLEYCRNTCRRQGPLDELVHGIVSYVTTCGLATCKPVRTVVEYLLYRRLSIVCHSGDFPPAIVYIFNKCQ